MRLVLSNYGTGATREVEVQGNPLLTYGDLRAGDGVPNARGGDGSTVAEWSEYRERWVWREDGSEWTDIEILTPRDRVLVSV